MERTLIERLNNLAMNRPEALALAFKDERITYKDLFKRICRVGNEIRSMGIQNNDRVLFSAVSKPETVVTYLGIQYAGGIAVFLDKNATAQTMASIYEECGAKLMLTDKPFKNMADSMNLASLREINRRENQAEAYPYRTPDDSDVAELLFTTGSTGKPKGVMLSYKAVRNVLLNTIEGIGITENDRLLLPLPLNHSFALRELRAYLWQGASVILQNGFTFVDDIESNITRYECNALALVPATAAKLKNQMQDRFVPVLSKLNCIEVSAGSLTVAQRLELTALLPNVQIYNTWGSSECGGSIFLDVNEAAKDKARVFALGKPLPHISIQAVGEDNSPIAATKDHPGRLALKGDMCMSGYWNRPELTEQTLVDGWLMTNDLVYIEDGFVYMLGRADDMIKVGGENVSPVEVENIAGQYHGIVECACIGVRDPDEILGQIPVLMYVTNDSSFAEEELNGFLVSQMERFKVPKKYVQIKEIPRNSMKKVDRKALKKLWEDNEKKNLLNSVVQNILSRRSIRKFTDQPIPREILDIILEAGYHAPSGHNMQTWRFTVLESKKTIDQLKTAMREAAATDKKVHFYGFENPDVVVLISNDKRNRDGCQDASCAAENMFLAANSFGIGSTWVNALMTLRDVEPAKTMLDKLGVPENHTVWCTAVFGYPVAPGNKVVKRTDVICYADRS